MLTENDQDTVDFIQESLGYFISYDNLYSTWIAKKHDFDIADVRTGLSAFARNVGKLHGRVFDGIFETLQTGLSKLGDSASAQTKSVRELIQLIRDIPTDGKQGYDVLGFVYEYLLQHFAANAGKKAGEFYTPFEVSQMMSEIVAAHVKDIEEIRIYDPTSGSGSLLLNIGTSIAKHLNGTDRVKYYAQELRQNTYNLTRMNLVMRGVKPANIVVRNGDTLEDDWPYFEEDDPAGSYEPLYVDAVVSNPPYSAHWDPSDKDTDPRFARFGLAPKGKADYAFLLHDLYHLKPGGIMTIVLPHGVLFRGGEEGKIRRALIENNHIDTIIGLPANIFFGTGIPTIVMVLKQHRDETEVLFVDASKGFEKAGKDNALRARDIRRIVDTVLRRASIDKFSQRISREQIREQSYNLNISRYVQSSEPAETWDVYASMFGGVPEDELDRLADYWEALPGLREKLFVSQGNGYAVPVADDLASVIVEDDAVARFSRSFSDAFDGFTRALTSRLVVNRGEVHIASEENNLATDIFDRLSAVPLVDEYQAFQLLHDHWIDVSADLEMIQTEGEAAILQVDPRTVIKKRNGRDTEVQDGWVGHILPFDLVQETLLAVETDQLQRNEAELSAVASEIEGLINSLSEEDKVEFGDLLTNDNTAFVIGPVDAAVKAARKVGDDLAWNEGSLEATAIKAKILLDRRRSLGAVVKAESTRLHLHTKELIENLSDQHVHELLVAKWVTAIANRIESLPAGVIADLTSRVTSLAMKYEKTLSDLEHSIVAVEQEVSGLIGQLTGSDTDLRALGELQKLLGRE